MMKRVLEILCAALLFCPAAVNGSEETAPSGAPSSGSGTTRTRMLRPGSVEQGDSTVSPGVNGKPETLIQNGTRVIYQEGGASTFLSAPTGRTPQYVNDSEGRVRQVTPVPEARPIPRRPNPADSRSSGSQTQHESRRPSPIQRPARPSGSSMPRSPFLRPNP